MRAPLFGAKGATQQIMVEESVHCVGVLGSLVKEPRQNGIGVAGLQRRKALRLAYHRHVSANIFLCSPTTKE